MRVKKLDLDLIPLLHAKEVRVKRKVLSLLLEGNWTAMLKGRGLEFSGFRKYTFGDDASRIDWGASLRAKETLVREFEEYKNVNILFVIDVSDTMLFTSQRKLKAEYAAEVVFNLAAASLENGDGIGYAMVTDRVVARSPPAIGRQALFGLAVALSTPKFYGGNKDFRQVMLAVHAMLKQKALIIVVSDFLGFQPGWERYVRILSQEYDFLGIMLRDPRDLELPDLGAQFFVEDPLTGERLFIDVNEYRDSYKQLVAEEREYIRSVFEAAKSNLILLTTDQDLLNPIITYFRKRSKIIKE